MLTNNKKQSGWWNRSRLQALIMIIAVGTATSACEDLLTVELPTKVAAENLENPALATVLVNSAIGEFECAYSQYVAASGQLTDELRHSSGWLVMTEWDHRKIGNTRDNRACNTDFGYGMFIPLQKARVSAESSKALIEGWADADVEGKADKIATLATYAALSRNLLGEAFCEMTIDVGPIMTPTQVLQSAETALGQAMSLASVAGRSDLENAARVVRARTRLTLGDKAGARTDAAGVPAGFVMNATYSGADMYRYNRIYQHNTVDGFISPEFNDANGMPTTDGDNPSFGGVMDPRVESTLAGIGQDGSPLRHIKKYSSWTSPIAIAKYAEARLIIAEVDMGQTAVDIINELHTAAGLPAYTPADVSDDAEILSHILQERYRELYLECRRLNDFLRHGLSFASGSHPYDGNIYGTDTCVALPQSERDSNPNT